MYYSNAFVDNFWATPYQHLIPMITPTVLIVASICDSKNLEQWTYSKIQTLHHDDSDTWKFLFFILVILIEVQNRVVAVWIAEIFRCGDMSRSQILKLLRIFCCRLSSKLYSTGKNAMFWHILFQYASSCVVMVTSSNGNIFHVMPPFHRGR